MPDSRRRNIRRGDSRGFRHASGTTFSGGFVVLQCANRGRPARLSFAPAALFVFAASFGASGQSVPDLDVPYVTTPEHVVDTMLGLAQVRSSDFVLDLGSGDGRIVIRAAEKLGARGLGVEIDPKLVELSNENARKTGVADRARFVQQDLFETNLGQASVITMYLLPDVNLKLRPALLKLKPGTRVVSHDWDMGDWEPDAKVAVEVPDKKIGLKKESTLMLWKVPARIDGAWTAGRVLHLQLTQKYQMLSGIVRFRGQTYDQATGKMDGDRVHLCFAKYDNGRCRVGALGQLAGSGLGQLVDGSGRPQALIIARRDAPPAR
jgi:SAM-dependent methyltransferase